MLLPILIGIVLIGFVILGIILHPVKTILRLASRIVFLVVLILAILGVFVVNDAKSFRNALESGEVLILLEANNSRVAGFAIHSLVPKYFSDQEMRSASFDEYDRTLVFSLEALRSSGLERVEIINGTRIDYEAAERILLAEDDRVAISQELAPELGVSVEPLKEDALKRYELGEPRGIVFSVIYAQAYGTKDLHIVSQIKDGLVHIEPAGMLSWAIKSTPKAWLTSASKVIR